MSTKKRLLRLVLVAFGLLLFVGYFTFRTFLFDPLEADFERDVAVLVPRDVDFFLARADIDRLFDGFPRLAASERLEKLPAWQVFRESQELRELDARYGIREQLARLEQDLARIPLGMEATEIFGRRDLAVAGYFRPQGLEAAELCVYGHVNWAGKLAVEALGYPGAIGLENQGIVATAHEEYFELSGGPLERPLYVTRIRDVVLASTTPVLASAAHELLRVRGTDSFYLSARYADFIERAPRGARRDEIELFVKVRKLAENGLIQDPLPDFRAQEFLPAFLGRLFQVPACQEVIGVLGVDGGLRVDLHGDLNSEKTTKFQQRFYRERGFDRAELLDVASFAPADSALFVYLKGPIGDLLRQLLESLDPAFRSNLEDALRGTNRYQSLDEVVQTLDDSLKNRLVLILRPNDYPPEVRREPETGLEVYVGPPNDGQPVFAAALVAWTEDATKLEELQLVIGHSGGRFGLEGAEPGTPGFWENRPGGYVVYEYWSRFVPGTGVITTMNDPAGLFMICNRVEMVEDVMDTYRLGGGGRRLSERVDFQALVDDSLPTGNVLVWLDPRAAAPTLRDQAEQWARSEVEQSFDWVALRERERGALLPEMFPGRSQRELGPQEVERLEAAVTQRLVALEEREQGERVTAEMAAKERQIRYLEAISAALIVMRLDPRAFDLSARIVVPLPE